MKLSKKTSAFVLATLVLLPLTSAPVFAEAEEESEAVPQTETKR